MERRNTTEICIKGMMRSGMNALFGSRVRPLMNLSVEDVRGYLASQLEHLKNKRNDARVGRSGGRWILGLALSGVVQPS